MKEFPILDAVATGKRIRELRKAKKLTVENVREFMGLESTQAIYKWQRGESLPSVDNLYALSSLFETSIDNILRGSREEAEIVSSFFAKHADVSIQWTFISVWNHRFVFNKSW